MPDAEIVAAKTIDEVNRELAIRDLGDINELRRSQPFNRYFVRRIREKMEPLQESILDDDKLTPDAREMKRKELQIFKSIITMLDSDEIGNHGITDVN